MTCYYWAFAIGLMVGFALALLFVWGWAEAMNRNG